MIRLRWLIIHCLLLGLPAAAPAWADVDVSEYQTRQAVRSEREREALQAAFERQRREEAARERWVREQESRRLADEQARRAARPYPIKLTEARCTLCHAAANFENARHALPGWWAVVLRMRYFNEAPLTWHEMSIIAAHLAESYPGNVETRIVEWGMLVGGLLLIPGALAFVFRRRSIVFRLSKKEQ